MSQYGAIYIYTELPNKEPVRLLRSVISVFEPDAVEFIHRQAEWREWESFERYINTDEDEQERPSRQSLAKIPPLEVPEYYQPGHVLSVSFGNFSPVAHRVYEDNMTLPDSIRGTFNPWSFGVALGWHDLYSVADDPHPRLFGRAFFSVRIGGQGTPADWAEYRRRVWELPAVVEVRRRLEPLLAAMKTCASWET